MTELNNELIGIQRETPRKNLPLAQLAKELETKVTHLAEALARVKQVEGILPICVYCKKIRDDSLDWHKVERYISASGGSVQPFNMRRLFGQGQESNGIGRKR